MESEQLVTFKQLFAEAFSRNLTYLVSLWTGNTYPNGNNKLVSINTNKNGCWVCSTCINCDQRLFVQKVANKGAFFGNYSVDSYSGTGITEQTEYQFPREQICAILKTEQLTWKKLRRWDRGRLGTQFSRQNRSILLPIAELTGYYSVHPGIRTVPKEHNYRQFCVFSFRNSPRRTRP